MTRSRSSIAYAVAGIAVLAFGALLVFSLLRLVETEHDMRRNDGDNMLWAISRAHAATLLLDVAVTRHAGVPESETDIKRRLDVLLSRLTLLSEGPQARYMANLGAGEALARHARAVETLESDIAGLANGDVNAAQAIHAVLAPLAHEIGRAANRSMVVHWETTGARLETQRAAIVQGIVSVLALTGLGVFISFTMLRAMAGKQRMQRSLTREQEVGEAYRSFVALVAHQFRTPLAVIDSGMQRLLRHGKNMSGDEIGERASRTRLEVKKLTQLIDTTLDAVRLDAGHIKAEPVTCKISDLADQIRARQMEATPDRIINLQTGDEVPPRIVTDPMLVEQILENLLSNAIKYSPDTEPVSMRIWAGNNRICFSFDDHGIGIPEAEQDRLFGRFFRASTAADTPGTGVGLSVSYQLARLLGGDLSFVSRNGIGSTFTLALPG